MLGRRILSAAVLIPVVGLAVYLGGFWLAVVVGLATLLAGWEFYAMLSGAGYEPSTALGLLFIALLLQSAYQPEWGLNRPVVAGVVMFTLAWQLFRVHSSAPMVDWALTVAGGMYLGWLMGHFLLLRAAPKGLRWLAIALLSTWICDSGAYLVGVSFGRHRLWPRISPKKSWEGAVAGWISGVVLTAVIAAFLNVGWSHGIAIGGLVGVVALFGDLTVSMLKRQVGVKDSSDSLSGRHLIPGHGGMLDRIDSLLFTVPVVYYYVRLVVR